MSAATRVGVVAIGRNEGDRLRRCLESLDGAARAVVYVDSGSTDGSVKTARELGAEIVELDLSIPFTAARARNAGVVKLREVAPNIDFIQFVDGDCEIADGWIDAALEFLDANDTAAVACGRRRERHPEETIYNQLCDLEWDTPIGEATACGGDALIRSDAFRDVDGYDESIIAGEEPEMCLRMRRRGWTIHRLDHEMTLHDASMTSFRQWWRRSVRCGHAYAEGRAMHGDGPERYRVHQVRSVVEWAVVLPLLALAFAWPTWGVSLALLGGYAALWHRVRKHRLDRGDDVKLATLYARYCVIGKFAELMGMLRFWFNHLRGRRSAIIEYKGAEAAA